MSIVSVNGSPIGLRPTAGYVQDGRRWVAEAQRALADSGLAREVVERAR